jgi:hypothetical protein
VAFEKHSEVDQVEVVGPYRCVQVRVAVVIKEDGQEVSRAFHRYVVRPGDDYSSEPELVRAICAAAHTTDIIAAYAAREQS